MSTGLKILLGFVAFFSVGLIGCVGLVVVSAGSIEESDTASNSGDSSETDDEPVEALPFDDKTDADDDLGSVETPYPFGTSHSREPGLLGAGWTISIDEVRTVGDQEFFAPETDGTCLVVLGTATLDTLDLDDELTSNGFSFPEIKLIAEGIEVESAIGSCETESLKGEGFVWVLDTELTPGTTVQWFQVFRPNTDGSYDFVAVENKVYAQP